MDLNKTSHTGLFRRMSRKEGTFKVIERFDEWCLPQGLPFLSYLWLTSLQFKESNSWKGM